MKIKIFLVINLIIISILNISFCEEYKYNRYNNNSTQRFISTLFYGTGIGFFTGLTAGWARYEDRHNIQNVWDSSGYGALGGMGLGLGAAIIGKEGTGYMFLNDLDNISSLGRGIGFIWGIISALFTGDSRRIGSGISWGHLSGFVLATGFTTYKIINKKYNIEEDRDGKDIIRTKLDIEWANNYFNEKRFIITKKIRF